MMHLKLKAITDYGNSVTNSLKELEPEFPCNCRPDEACLVEITELPGSQFEAVVTMPRPIRDSENWMIHPETPGVYSRTFDEKSTAEQIHQFVARILVSEMMESEPSADSASPREVIVVVDPATLQKAQNLIVGCEQCTGFPEIPFRSILDSVVNEDPTATRYILATGSATCPRCGRSITLDSLVEFQPLHDDD
jgi:hypothetical protein